VPILFVVGFVVGLFGLVWAWVDIGRFPPQVWYWSGHRRESWRAGLIVAYLVTGWPAIVVALAWWRSETRVELRDEARYLREAHRRRTA